jgi:hypothetical protein
MDFDEWSEKNHGIGWGGWEHTGKCRKGEGVGNDKSAGETDFGWDLRTCVGWVLWAQGFRADWGPIPVGRLVSSSWNLNPVPPI